VPVEWNHVKNAYEAGLNSQYLCTEQDW